MIFVLNVQDQQLFVQGANLDTFPEIMHVHFVWLDMLMNVKILIIVVINVWTIIMISMVDASLVNKNVYSQKKWDLNNLLKDAQTKVLVKKKDMIYLKHIQS